MFFFHFFDGVEHHDDDAGVELSSMEEAYLEAVASARSMWAELLESRHNPSHCAFMVTDERHETLFRFPFSELLERCRFDPSGRAGSIASSTAGLRRALQETHNRVSAARIELDASILKVRQALRESGRLLARLDGIARSPAGRPRHDDRPDRE